MWVKLSNCRVKNHFFVYFVDGVVFVFLRWRKGIIRRIPAMLFHFCLWCIIHSTGGIAAAEEIIEGSEKGASGEIVKKHNNHAHRGLPGNLGFSNFFEG